jgi:tripartite-type tricarboxylate transporter receptor subunit TctC
MRRSVRSMLRAMSLRAMSLRAMSWGGLSMLCLIAPTVQAQPVPYPSKTVRLIVPIAAGGAVDISTRFVADRLSKKWGQPVVVENRPGGGGTIGAQTVASTPADGYTLLATPAGEFTIAPLINPRSEALYAGFQPIVLMTDNPIVIVANSSFGASTLPELIALAKNSPEPLAYASAHTGSSVHFAGEWVASATGVKLRHIPFRGGAPAAVAVVGGELPLASLPVLVAAPFVKSGQIKSIAITSAKRISSAPDWPTVAEAGYPDVDISVWVGLFAQKGVPKEIIEKIERDTREILEEPEFRARIVAIGAEPGGMSGKDFADKIAREQSSMKRIITDTKLRLE